MPYVIDRKANDPVTLAKLTSLGIRHLYSGNGRGKGFFMMVEGGKIDWSCHSNDFGGMVQEVKDFDEAVKVALDFYRKHPESTTIVVTADHETGGLRELKGKYTFSRKRSSQKQSYAVMCRKLDLMRKQKVDFNKIISVLKEWYGIKKLSAEEQQRLAVIWEKSKARAKGGKNKKRILYGSFKPLIFCMQRIYSSRNGVEWETTSHTGQNVPVTAVGVNAEIFAGTYDNTQIAVKLRALITGKSPREKIK
jgi:alkaline phosphatase